MLIRLTLALICACNFWGGAVTAEPRLVFSGKASLQTGGGLSGLELNADGNSGITISDRGDLFTIDLKRTNGVLQNAQLTPWAILPKLKGDVEGIATNNNQTYFFSLEVPARVISVSKSGKITMLPSHPDFEKMSYNRQLEGIAIDKDGALYTLPESADKKTKTFPLFRFKSGKWNIVTQIPKGGFFSAVGADFGPENRLYLLERSISPLGFRTRVRRFDLNQKDLVEETLLTTGQLSHDNLEGISVWQDTNGKTRVTMISDDNNIAILRNEVVEYILEE